MNISKTMSRRAQLLSGVGLALLAAAPAYAGTTAVRDNTIDANLVFTRDYNRLVNAFETINAVAINDEQVAATVSVSGGVTHTNTTTVAGAPIASTNTINTNTVVAQATGNTVTNAAALLALDSDVVKGDGIAMLSMAQNTRDGSNGYVTSLATNSSITGGLTNRPTDTANVDGNTIAARTNVNVSTSVASGQVPNTYTSATAGSAFVDQYAYSYFNEATEGDVYQNKLSSIGSIVASTMQISDPSADSWASAAGNQVKLDLLSSTYQDQSGTGTLDDNTIAATFAGNTSTSAIGIEGGANPTFTGSAVVTTSQISAGNDIEGATSAGNMSSVIAARVIGDDAAFGEGWLNNLTGSVSVNNNAITAAATGNLSTGNLISLDSGINVVGTSTNAEARVDNSEGAIAADGTLVIAASQLMDGEAQPFSQGKTSAWTDNASISGYAQEIRGGSLDVSGNTIAATSNGNKYGAEIATSELVNEISGGVVVGTQQMSADSNVFATVSNSSITATGGSYWNNGEVSDASISLTDNTVTAAAYGNQGANAITLDATTLNGIHTGLADLEAYNNGWSNPIGSVVIGSSQTNGSSPVTADNINSLIELNSFDNEGTNTSTLIVSRNQQEAVAVGNLVDNAIGVTATTTGSGIGIASAQNQYGGSNVTATFDGTARLYIEEDVGDNGASTVSLIDNTQRAVAYANSAINDLSVSATTANIGADGSWASQVENSAYASVRSLSAFGVLNNQYNQADVTATTRPLQNGYSNFEVYVDLDVQDGSAVRNDGNSAIAAATGSAAVNSATVEVNSLGVNSVESNYAPLASVTSGQYLDWESTISSQVTPDGDAGVLTYVNEDLYGGSSVSTSSNTLLAQALGNTVVNGLTVKSTNISSYGDGGAVWHDGEAYADAALSINSVQDAEGGIESSAAVRSTLRSNFGSVTEGTTSQEIRSVVNAEVSDSSLVSLDNVLSATAGSNRAVNTLDLTTTGLQASVGVSNLQETSNYTLASMGVEGTAGTPAGDPTNFSYTATITNLSATFTAPSTYTITTATASVPLSSLTAAQQTYLENNGWTISGSDLVGTPPAGVIGTALTQAQYAAYLGSTQTLNGSIPGTPAVSGTPYIGGVFAEVNSDVSNSTIRVDGNRATGTAIGNDAANTISVAATTVSQSSNYTLAHAHSDDANADVALINGQNAYNTQAATVINTFAIEQEANNAISNSLLSVSDNRQSATAVGNLADNALSLTATDLASDPTTTALASRQYSDSNVDAYSIMQVYAPVQSSGSTIQLNGNSNTALGVQNDVANALSVVGTNIGSNSGIDATASAGDASQADNALYSVQTAYGTLDTVAGSVIFNQDVLDADTTGVVNGTVEMNGNTTLAESTANRAANTLLVDGTANQGSTSALGNHQNSYTSVTATATTVVNTGLTGVGTMLNASTASVDGNVTQALARGNSAANSLTTSAAATYPAVGGNTLGGAGSANTAAAANAVLLNDQTNYGSVNASANNTTYTVVLNSGVSTQAVTNSTVNVNNNRVTAVAYGNQATNTLTMTPLNSGLATGAIASNQSNTGAVIATASSVTFGFSSASGLTNASTLRSNGNAVTASAVGNSVVSSIIAK